MDMVNESETRSSIIIIIIVLAFTRSVLIAARQCSAADRLLK